MVMGSRLVASVLCMTIAVVCTAQIALAQSYFMYVANESDDSVMLVKFDGQKFSIPDTIEVGTIGTEIESPHGLAIDPDGEHWFVSMAHGQPYGKVVRYSTVDQRPNGSVTLGLFPASMAISPHTGLLYVANFNLHGNEVPSSISVVDPSAMVEVARITTGIMPHGSAFAPEGTRHYSVAMMSHELIELDALQLHIQRRIPLGKGTQPTWVTLDPKLPLAYIAGNGSDEIIIVNTESGEIVRRVSVSGSPYHIAISTDGSLLAVTLKGAQAVTIIDLPSGIARFHISTSRPVSHGVVIDPESQYAFVTSEGIGAKPGVVDAIHLMSGKILDSIDAGQQTGGIAFWKISDS